ncbi:MAG TPA: hypothetical protein VM784_10760 [Actinomycetota bacterium]|nr:hypothetical protein [Actinomycetota bacterium]
MDTVKVAIPAAPQYVQVVRLIAAGLASRLGFTLDEIDDLKIGVDELAAYLTGTQGRDGRLDIVFGVAGQRITIDGTAHLSAGDGVRTDLTDFSRMILDTVADEASLTEDGGKPSFHLVKSRGS